MMLGTNLFAWVSLILAIVGLVLFARRVILWQLKKATPQSQPLEPVPTSALTPEHRILVISNGEQSGPYTRTEVLVMLNSGRLSPEAMCWEPGQGDWKPVKTLSGI